MQRKEIESFSYPDFDGNNIINITSTLASFLGNQPHAKMIPELKKELEKGYKNVLFLVFDAMGTHPLKRAYPFGQELSKHIVKELTTVFPSTTACASASFLTGLYPSEHGRFGWCMYLPTFGGRVDILTGEKSEDHSYHYDMDKIRELFPMEAFYKDAPTDYQITSILPCLIDDKMPYRRECETIPQLFSSLDEICARIQKQFVYAHCPQPDGIFHHYGVTSKEGAEAIDTIEKNIQTLLVNHPDTLAIVSADHGQVDIKGYVPFYLDKKLNSYLSHPIHIEVRAMGLDVIEGMEKEFEEYFENTYSGDFALFETEDLIQKGVFGPRTEKLNLIGNYLAIGTATDTLGLMHNNTDCFLGQHTSLTMEEMTVPLILWSGK